MKRIGFVLAVALLALAGCSKKPAVAVAGVYASHGDALLTRPGKKPYRRTVKPGMTVLSDMTLSVDSGGAVVLEGFNGALLPLGEGEHDIEKLARLAGTPKPRQVWLLGETAEQKELPPLIVVARYEPTDSGKLKLPAEEEEGLAAFMKFGTGGDQKVETAPSVLPPPRGGYLRALKRPLAAPAPGEGVVSALAGTVVVEFRDRSTALAGDLKTPVALSEVRRVVVIDGSAKVTLPDGKTVELSDGQEAEVPE